MVRGTIALVVASLALVACVPETAYRNAAVTPAARALPWDGGTAEAGSLRLEGGASVTTVVEKIPKVHDSALHVPLVTAEGSMHLAVTRGLELGLRGAYAAYGWTQESAFGTLAVPSQSPTWGIGPEMRASISLDRRGRFALGFGANFLQYSVPYAEWAANGAGGFRLVDEKSSSMWALGVAFYPSINVDESGRFGHVFFGFTAHTQFGNEYDAYCGRTSRLIPGFY